jgi:hypothetical protein
MAMDSASQAGRLAGPVFNTISKGVGPSTTLARPGWKQPDILVEVDTGRLETDVGRQEF